MNLTKILNTLLPDYQIVKVEPEKKAIVPNTYVTTDFNKENTFDVVLYCIVYQLNLDFDKEKENMLQNLRDFTFNELINIKKVLMSIENNQMNNEVKIFLSGYYQLNIYVYHTMSQIMKIFYLEDNLCTNRESILLFYNHDLDPTLSSYQTALDVKLFTHNEDYLATIVKDIYTIPVGLTANKILTYSDNQDHVTFYTGKIDANEENFINEENILFNTNIPRLQDNNVYDYRTFDVKAFNERYNKEEFLFQLNSLKSK